MGDLATTLLDRVEEARRDFRQARADGDVHGADVFAAELEDLQRRAAAHGIIVPEAEPDGPATPGAWTG